MLKTTRNTLLPVLLLCVFFSSQLIADEDDLLLDPFYTKGQSSTAPPQGSVQESVDPYSGYLSLVHTDLHLPGNGGLDLNIVRSYHSAIWGRRDTSFPRLIAGDYLPLGIGWSLHMGMIQNPDGKGSRNRFLPDNPVVIMPNGSKHILYHERIREPITPKIIGSIRISIITLMN